MNLDKLDTKILEVINIDARSPESEIGKKARTSKQVVRYRLKKLEEEGIIENYYTIINVGHLGFDSHYIFIQLTGIDGNKEKELYNKIIKLDYVAWLVTGIGRWDAVILFCSDSINKFDEQLSELKNIFGKNLHEYQFTTLVKAKHLDYKFTKTKTNNFIETTPKNKQTNLDKIDKKILLSLNQKARSQITEISNETKIPTNIIYYRLKQLKKKKIIEGFKPKINIQKLGLQWHLLLITLGNISEKRKQEFNTFCEQHKNVYYITNTVGKYSLMIDIHVKSLEEFREFLFEIKNKFSDAIKLYESMMVFEEKLITYIPKIILLDK